MHANRDGDNKFSFGTIKNFDDHINKSIPCYQNIFDCVVNMSKYFIQENTNVYDIGCSTGKLLKSINAPKNVVKIGIDNSLNLLPENNDNMSFINLDLSQDFIFNNASFITSLFTIQFLPLKVREKLISNIYAGLNKGGAFVFCEKIYSENSKIQDIFTFQYYDYKKSFFSNDEILDKEDSLRSIMFPLSHEENINMLKKAGFNKIDIFIKHFNFEAILAIK